MPAFSLQIKATTEFENIISNTLDERELSLLFISSYSSEYFNLRGEYKINSSLSLIKCAHFIRDKDELILYSPLKLKYSDEYDEIKSKLSSLSSNVLEIIFSNSVVAFIWREKAGITELEKILNLLKVF